MYEHEQFQKKHCSMISLGYITTWDYQWILKLAKTRNPTMNTSHYILTAFSPLYQQMGDYNDYTTIFLHFSESHWDTKRYHKANNYSLLQ